MYAQGKKKKKKIKKKMNKKITYCESSETTDSIYPNWRISTSKSLADFNHNISQINNRIKVTGISEP